MRMSPKVCTCVASSVVLAALGVSPVEAGDIYVGPGGSLQAAIDAAQPGDRILLAPGTTFSGNFRLPNKGSSDQYITIRSAAPDALLPPDGVRVTPADAPNLPRIQSPTTMAALRTDAGAHHWRLQWLEFGPNDRGYHEIISLGAADSTQTSLGQVPHHIVLDRVYVHGDPVIGQKRGIGLNSAYTWILNSYVADIKGVGMDTQAIAAWNGPGPWVVSNNYLEAAGENIIVGGADPKISNLVASDLEFSRNHLYKPTAWRAAILQTPTGVSANPGTGGSLPAGTYSYRIVAVLRTAQESMAYSARSAEVVTSVGSSGKVVLAWTPVPNAQSYRIYRGTAAGQQDRYFSSTSASFTDAGTATGTTDNGAWISATRWTVKNIFELKSAQRVLVDGNVMEHNWLQAQNGFAVLFTPRNQDGTAPWTVVRDVTFTNNIVRHSGSAVNILGYDNLATSQQTRNITIRNNVFYDISGTNWGGDGRFVLMGDQPRDIVIDHNTVVHTSTIVYAYGGSSSSPRQILGVVITNNLFRHNAYGIMGDGRGSGNDTLNTYMPDAVVQRNTFAGGNSWSYPANNEFPTVTFWQSQFVNFAADDYRLVTTSPYIGTAADGTDLGADLQAIAERTQAALSGRESGDTGTIPVAILTSSLPSPVVGASYSARLTASGGSGLYAWTIAAGALPPGLALDAATGVIGGVASVNGSYTFSAAAADVQDPSNVGVRQLQMTCGGQAPQVSLTAPAAGTTITGTTVPLQASASDPDGSVVRVDFYAGASLVATSAASPWAASWSNVPPGGYELRAVATDNQGLSATSAAVTITVSTGTTPPPSPLPSPEARPAGEIVLWAADVTRFAGSWRKVSDSTAAGGMKLSTADAGWNSMIPTGVDVALATPQDFFEAAFDAPAGVPYYVWVRLRAVANGSSNDSVFVQFSDAVDTSGAPVYRAGTTDGLLVNLEDCKGCGSSGWGWQDGSFWIAPVAVQFAGGGTHVVRVQVREDGVEVDQIVLTPAASGASAPGPVRDDATLLAKTARPSADVVVYARDFAAADVQGHWARVSSTGSPGGISLRAAEGRWKTQQPLASPAHYVDVTFAAGAGIPYRVWLRLRATKNSVASDAVWLQFTDTVSGSTPVFRMSTTGGFGASLQTCKTCKPSGWGWTGGAYGLVQPATVTFAWSGLHRLRIQTWEDGVEVDQVVLSPVRYFNSAPGAVRNDTTIVAKP
jgi:hypothetical protein